MSDLAGVAQEMFDVWFAQADARIAPFAPRLGEALRDARCEVEVLTEGGRMKNAEDNLLQTVQAVVNGLWAMADTAIDATLDALGVYDDETRERIRDQVRQRLGLDKSG